MITADLVYPSTTSRAQLLQQLPLAALVDTTLAAHLLDTSVDALEKQRHRRKGIPTVHLSRRRVRYCVGDVKRALAERGE